MFNDIEKKLKLSGILNLIVGVLFTQFSAKFMKIVIESDVNGEPFRFMPQKYIVIAANIIMVLTIIVSILSYVVAFAIEKNKRDAFKWMEKAGKPLRIAAWTCLIGGLAGVFMFTFWCFFNVISDNAIVNAISYAIIAIVPCAVLAVSFAFFLYGLGNAADGGDATYVVNSKLFDVAPLHDDSDNRKICPNCGTRTDKHSCPNCGVKID